MIICTNSNSFVILNHYIIHGRWQPRIPWTQEIASFFLILLKKSLSLNSSNLSVTPLPKKSVSSAVLLSIRFSILTVFFLYQRTFLLICNTMRLLKTRILPFLSSTNLQECQFRWLSHAHSHWFFFFFFIWILILSCGLCLSLHRVALISNGA